MQIYEDYSAFSTIKSLTSTENIAGISPIDEFSYSLKSNFDKLRYNLQVLVRKMSNEKDKDAALKYEKERLINEIHEFTVKNNNLLKIQ